MFFCDTHTHSDISPDSDAPLLSLAEEGVRLELDALYITDHCDLLDWDGTPIDTFPWAAAKERFYAARGRTAGKLDLRLGLELGSPFHNEDAARRIIAEGGEELDFVLGSVHNWLGSNGNIDYYSTRFTDAPRLCREALDNCLACTWTLITDYRDCCDSLAHIVYPLRYMRRDGQNFGLDSREEEVRRIFRRMAEEGVALEVNTCRGTSLEEWLPILRRFRECGGELVTLGSDAHAPGHLAKGIREAAPLLQAAGFRYSTVFSRRKPVCYTL